MLREHYKSFQASVKEDFPEGFKEYTHTSPTNNPTFPHPHEYFLFISSKINENIEKNDTQAYLASLYLFQDALLKVITTFVRGKGYENMGYPEWRFNSVVVKFDKFTLIPYYSEEFYYPGPVFSVWELKTALKMDQSLLPLILQHKGDSILTPQQQLLPVNEVNRPLVKDWTLPL